MNVANNIREGIKSIKGNKLRTIITATIIALGITALVGVLTGVDSLKSSIDTSFSSLGANTFDVRSKRSNRGTQEGVQEKSFEPLRLDDVLTFQEKFDGGLSTLHAQLSWNAEAKRFSKKTNPNTNVTGVDENFMLIRNYNIEKGRNFNENDIQYNADRVIIGTELVKTLFEENEDPLNKTIGLFGKKFKVIGVLEKKGGFGGQNWADRTVFMPLGSAIRLAEWNLGYTITINVTDPTETEEIIGEATSLMRRIREDPLGQEDSFEISRNKTVAEELDEIGFFLKVVGGIISSIILLGACIGLMNIMLVSVTERTQEIGIRKALGATPSRIREQFLFEALVICFLGGIGGIIFGTLAGNTVAVLMNSNKFVAPWQWIFGGLLICVIVGVISGIYPAIKASKMDPIESLRYE